MNTHDTEDIEISFKCSNCRQYHNEWLHKVLFIETVTKYIGSGDYVSEVQSVGLLYPACKGKIKMNLSHWDDP